jgi:hypothetical protein
MVSSEQRAVRVGRGAIRNPLPAALSATAPPRSSSPAHGLSATSGSITSIRASAKTGMTSSGFTICHLPALISLRLRRPCCWCHRGAALEAEHPLRCPQQLLPGIPVRARPPARQHAFGLRGELGGMAHLLQVADPGDEALPTGEHSGEIALLRLCPARAGCGVGLSRHVRGFQTKAAEPCDASDGGRKRSRILGTRRCKFCVTVASSDLTSQVGTHESRYFAMKSNRFSESFHLSPNTSCAQTARPIAP